MLEDMGWGPSSEAVPPGDDDDLGLVDAEPDGRGRRSSESQERGSAWAGLGGSVVSYNQATYSGGRGFCQTMCVEWISDRLAGTRGAAEDAFKAKYTSKKEVASMLEKHGKAKENRKGDDPAKNKEMFVAGGRTPSLETRPAKEMNCRVVAQKIFDKRGLYVLGVMPVGKKVTGHMVAFDTRDGGVVFLDPNTGQYSMEPCKEGTFSDWYATYWNRLEYAVKYAGAQTLMSY